MLKLILSSMLIATGVLAQDSVMIRDFSGGLNTVSSDFAIDTKYARFVHNFDLGRNVGALTRRLGYDSVSAYSSTYCDSIRYPYGVYLPDGRQLLALSYRVKSQSFGQVRTTGVNDAIPVNGVMIANYWGMKYPTTYAMQNGILFIANGQNRMVAYDAIGGKFGTSYPDPYGNGARYSRPIPPYSPGEIEVYPLLDTAGSPKLYGDYMWTITIRETGGGVQKATSYITPRMRIDSGRALLAGFRDFAVADTIDPTPDSCFIKVYRTKANPGPLTHMTVFYYTGDSVVYPSGASTVVDDVPDASLSSTDSLFPRQYAGANVLNWKFGPRAGQPRIIRHSTDRKKGMARNTSGSKIMKWIWAMTYVDTTFDAESDTGSSITLDSALLSGNDTTRFDTVVLSLLPPDPSYTNMAINVYRAPVFAVLDSIDSTWLPGPYRILSGTKSIYNTRDSGIVGPFRLIGHLLPTDTIFVDTFSLSQWSTGQILRQNRPPSGINNLVSYSGRVFGSNGSRLYLTLLDSGSFAQMRFIDINQDDGDEITAIFPTRRALRVMKGGSSYNVYQDDAGDWSRSEVSNGIGCIAPRSIAHSAAGWYYLSNKGVILENDGPYIERTQATQLISAPLKNFDSLTMAAKRLAVGVCVDNKYLLCIGDTSYVWDERAQAWSTWSLKFNGATLYGVDANINFVRPDTLYFTQPNSRTLFRYGSSKYDNGVNFNMEWRSAPLLLDNADKRVNALGVWHKSVDTSDVLDFRILDESGTQVAAYSDTGLLSRYARLSMPANLGRGFQIRLLNTDYVSGSGLTRTIIDGIDMYYQRQGKVGE